MVLATVKMVLALGGVCALLLILLRLSRRIAGARRSAAGDREIRLLTSRPIAPQKYISLVEIGGEILALGVSPQQITFLTRIENKELLREVSPASLAGPASPCGPKSSPRWTRRIKGGPPEDS